MRPVSRNLSDLAARDLVGQADSLGIPWKRILSEEIRAERMLRLCISDVCADWPLWAAFWILPGSLLHCWRVRSRIDALSWTANRDHCETSVRQLRALHAHFLGRRDSRGTDATLMAKHLWFGYQRVLGLARISRLAEKIDGDPATQLDCLRKQSGCSVEEASWAVERAGSAARGHRLDDAMRRARDEGFELPEDENEVRAFRRLRSFVRSSPHLARLQKR